MKILHETCLEYFRRRLSEGWKCIGLEGHNAVLLSPEGFRRELDLRNDVETLRPNAAGDETNLTPMGNGANWECVDEAVADEFTTYVEKIGYGYLRDLYNLPASSGSGTINFIKVYFRCTRGTGGGLAKPALKSNSTVTDGDEVILHDLLDPAEWHTFSQQWNTNPADAGAWEWADIDALQIGVSIAGTGALPAYCTQVYVEVDYTYTPPTPPVTPEYQRRVLMQKQPDGSYKEVSADYPFEVHDPKVEGFLFSMDFWSDMQEEVAVTSTAGDKGLPSVAIADLPETATIVRAVAMFKFRMIENTHATESNNLVLDQYIQVKKSGQAYTNAIKMIATGFAIAAATREGGDVIIGNIDLAGANKVDANATYEFLWKTADAAQDSLNFNDVACGIRIYYSI